jgi:hypothetical protein
VDGTTAETFWTGWPFEHRVSQSELDSEWAWQQSFPIGKGHSFPKDNAPCAAIIAQMIKTETSLLFITTRTSARLLLTAVLPL